MRPTVKNMIKKYSLLKLKIDFMGYKISSLEDLSFHHLIIPVKGCTFPDADKGYLECNGAILKHISHNYLHVVEEFDLDRFYAITSELIDEIIKGHLSLDNLNYINDILEGFEKEYYGKARENGNIIIKEEYLDRVLKQKNE